MLSFLVKGSLLTQNPNNNKWMSLCIMECYISETWPPILMKLGMKFTHLLIVNRGKFHLILPINKNFLLIKTFSTNVFIHVYHVTLYLWNLTTNFDVTWHEVHPYTDSGSSKVSFDITHKQKFFINNNILYKRLYSVFL